jgi:hypothetical protein
MAEAREFDCADCGARAGNPCVYMMPAGQPYSLAFWTKDSVSPSERWKYVEVPWSGVRPYAEDVRLAAKSYRYLAQWPDEDLDDIETKMPLKFRNVGKPLRAKEGHAARIRALYDWEQMTERQAMQQYLGEWLAEFGSIFEEVA